MNDSRLGRVCSGISAADIGSGGGQADRSGEYRLLGPAGASDTGPECQASLASVRMEGSAVSLAPSGPVMSLAAARGRTVWRQGAGSVRQSRCSRIFLITAGSSMLAITLTAPPQWSQVSISILNTRFKRCAQVIETWRAGAGSSVGSASRRPRLAGVTCSRNRWFGANTPW